MRLTSRPCIRKECNENAHPGYRFCRTYIATKKCRFESEEE